MKVPNTPTLLMASLALSSSTLAVPVDKHIAQSPHLNGGMSPRSPQLAGRTLDHDYYKTANLPHQMMAHRGAQAPPDGAIPSPTGVVHRVRGLVAGLGLGPVVSDVEGILSGIPGGTVVNGVLDSLGLKLAETKDAEQFSSLIQNQNRKRDEDSQDGSQGLIPGIQAPANTPNPQLLTPNPGIPYLGQAVPVPLPNIPNPDLAGLSGAGLSGVSNLIPSLVPGVAGLIPNLSPLAGGISPSTLQPILPIWQDIGALEALEKNHMLAEVDSSGSATTISPSTSTPAQAMTVSTVTSSPGPSESASASSPIGEAS